MTAWAPPLTELFPDGNYEFQLTLRRTTPQEFFQSCDSSGARVAERRRWLAEAPGRYAALLPEGRPLLEEFAALTEAWGVRGITGPQDSFARLLELGGSLEPDLLFLSRDDSARFRLRGGALCFPTSWALEEKLGRTLESIHDPVPGLNDALAAPIHQFLARLRPGIAYVRHNWGIAATDTLNLHPARNIPPPCRPLRLENVWLRVEHQALVALPESGGVVFGIRIALHRLDRVAGTPAAAGLRRAIETMPLELIGYKRLDEVRESLLELL
jgi:hypothetical protein